MFSQTRSCFLTLAVISIALTSAHAAGTIRNVITYGAVGDGVTNDCTAISAALTASVANDTIYFPPGNYYISGCSLAVTKGQTIKGDGSMTTTITAGSLNTTIWNITTTSPVEVRDMRLQYPSPATGGACINVEPASGENSRSQFLDLRFWQCHTALKTVRASAWTLSRSYVMTSTAYGVIAQNVNNHDSGAARVAGNNFEFNPVGIRWLSGSALDITDNKVGLGVTGIEINVGSGVTAAGILHINGNSIEQNQVQIQITSDGTGCPGPSCPFFPVITITGNQVGSYQANGLGVIVDGNVKSLTITGNTFNSLFVSGYSIALTLRNWVAGSPPASNAVVSGNVFHSHGGTVYGIWVMSGFDDAVIGENAFDANLTYPITNQSGKTRIHTTMPASWSTISSSWSSPSLPGSIQDGSLVYCRDCTPGACSTPGTGAMVMRRNGAWVCF